MMIMHESLQRRGYLCYEKCIVESAYVQCSYALYLLRYEQVVSCPYLNESNAHKFWTDLYQVY